MIESIMMWCCHSVDPTETLRQMKDLTHLEEKEQLPQTKQNGPENNLTCQIDNTIIDCLGLSLISFI